MAGGRTGRQVSPSVGTVERAIINGGVSFSVEIDITQIIKLGNALADIGSEFQNAGRQAVARGINTGLAKVRTELVRAQEKWVGADRQKQIREAITIQRVNYKGGGGLEGKVVTSAPWLKITGKDFGAVHTADVGVTHNAWGRSQLARKAFMLPGIDVAFRRIGKERSAIKPLWGPNLAREVERHEPEVMDMLARGAVVALTEAERQIELSIDAAKARYGL